MADVYEPEIIQENPFPYAEVQPVSVTGDSGANQTYSPSTIKGNPLPKKRSAVELLSTSLNTRSRKILEEFELAQSGAIKIGDFKLGETGEVAITPNGLTAKDISGLTTFALDGTDGSATFKGTIQAGALIAGEVTVGNNRVIIEVDSNGQPSIIVNDGVNDRVLIGYQENGF